jgi:dienelactone hydrolase
MSERVKFPSTAGEAEGVLFGSAPAGVVVIQEWWGVNEQIQSTAKKWADAGFTAIVPDLFHGKVAKTWVRTLCSNGPRRRRACLPRIKCRPRAQRASGALVGDPAPVGLRREA